LNGLLILTGLVGIWMAWQFFMFVKGIWGMDREELEDHWRIVLGMKESPKYEEKDKNIKR